MTCTPLPAWNLPCPCELLYCWGLESAASGPRAKFWVLPLSPQSFLMMVDFERLSYFTNLTVYSESRGKFVDEECLGVMEEGERRDCQESCKIKCVKLESSIAHLHDKQWL